MRLDRVDGAAVGVEPRRVRLVGGVERDREALTEPWHRLSCQARVMGDVIVYVPLKKWDARLPRDQRGTEAEGVKQCGLP